MVRNKDMVNDILTCLDQLNAVSVLVRIFMATIAGSLIGLNRGKSGQPAGMRTHILVCIGAAVVMLTGQYIYERYGTGDPSRLGAQVVSGIGFLGAGSILSDKEKVRGLTTAAGLWASACIGLAVGVGFYFVAVVATIMEMLVLTWVKGWEQKLMPENVQFHLYMETRTTATETVIRKMEKMGLKIEGVSVAKKKKSEFQKVVFSVHNMGKSRKEEVLHVLGNMEEVRCVKYRTET